MNIDDRERATILLKTSFGKPFFFFFFVLFFFRFFRVALYTEELNLQTFVMIQGKTLC